MKKFIKKKIISIIKVLLQLIKSPVEDLKKNYLFKFNNISIKVNTSNLMTYRRWSKFEIDGKEKDTIEWINSFEEGSVFFDIGANVGIFSIYAALKKKLKVYSFEPDPNSFLELYNAIKLNNANVTTLLVALDNNKNSKFFNMESFGAGLSYNYLSEKRDEKNLKGGKDKFVISTTTVDDLILNKLIKTPDYIKIDVDGNEKNILDGSRKVLKDEKIKSVLIEDNDKDEDSYYESFFKDHNFELVYKNLKSGNSIYKKKKLER